MMYLSHNQAIRVADQIATAITIPYRGSGFDWTKGRPESTHPAWNKHNLVRAAVSLARVPEPRH